MVIGVKTIYRHPKGRFEVRETTHHAFGNTYTVREKFAKVIADWLHKEGDLLA